ncbi:MAG: trypsin-like peptidase domain-containing protein [Holosporaceae bacterium]|jgi:hypothetical protein|nr:trypsin-like peptidase domain-containing protein [Holosporaceae bacterium]
MKKKIFCIVMSCCCSFLVTEKAEAMELSSYDQLRFPPMVENNDCRDFFNKIARLQPTEMTEELFKKIVGYDVDTKNYINFAKAVANKYGEANPVITRENAGSVIVDCIKKMIEFADAVRNGDLYKKIAKFVGRVEIPGGCTGTGTLVYWDGMPKSLEGRVVITCGHNHDDFNDESKWEESRKCGNFTIYKAKNVEDTKFTPDTSKGFEIRERKKCSRSKDVEAFYIFTGGGFSHFYDFAVFVLKYAIAIKDNGDIYTPSKATNKDDLGSVICLTDDTKIPEENCFTIGYGKAGHQLPCDQVGNFSGKDLKKRTKTQRWRYNDKFKLYVTDDTLFLNPGDSGSPIVNANGEMVGIATGSLNYSIVGFAKEINKLCELYANKKS